MLGYFYNVDEDKMRLADFEFDPDATMIRQILAQTSKVYLFSIKKSVKALEE